MLRAMLGRSLWIRLTITGVVLAGVCLFQLPLEPELPGEPFLLFLLVVIASTLAFGASVGFVAVASSTLLSALFFEPVGSFAVRHAADLLKIELYAILAGGCVVAFAHLVLMAARDKTDALNRLDESKSILVRELAHGVANNFAAVAAFVRMKSSSISDAKAKSVLDEVIEQVRVMGSVHRRLRGGDAGASLDSQAFLHDLCEELEASMVRGRPLSIECKADSRQLCADQAVSLGLIVNELVTNAVKHAFPQGRAGCIRVSFEVVGGQVRLCVEDDGAGFDGRVQPNVGIGQDLVRGLARQLGGELEVKSTKNGSSFRLSVPYVAPSLSTPAARSLAALIH
jgi:two-component system, sensor histidine kinase PdtaS